MHFLISEIIRLNVNTASQGNSGYYDKAEKNSRERKHTEILSSISDNFQLSEKRKRPEASEI